MEQIRRVEEEDSRLADWVLGNLRLSLQLLTTRAQDQIAYFTPIPFPVCNEDEMALEYDHWARCVHTYWELTHDQVAQLTVLDDSLLSLSGQSHSSFRTDEALFTDQRWVQVRHLAKLALVSFGWPVEVPPPEQHPERYIRSRPFEGKPGN